VGALLTEWEVEDMIRDVVQEIAENKVAKFYPTFVAKATHLPLNTVYGYLLQMVKTGRLILKWEIRCENCYRNIDSVPEFDEYLDQEISCKWCGHDTFITREHIFPVFAISEKYKEKARQGKENIKKKKSLLQLT
jgi:hypothetical protein